MRRITMATLVPLLLVATAATTGPEATTVTFTGHVVDNDTDRPLSSVQLRLQGTSFGTLTDSRGAYSLDVSRDRLPNGGVQLIAELIGYGREVVTVESSRYVLGDTVDTDFRLRPTSLSLEQVTVLGVPGITHPRAMGATQTEIASDRSGAPLPASAGLTPADLRGRHPGWNREQYGYIEENDFLGVEGNPLSTFSIDVDRASYSNIRRFLLREARLPPVDAVHIEEMVNYFSYDYALPDGERPLAVTTELGVAPWRKEHLLLRIGLASAAVDTEDLPPNNFVFLLDVSGSMTPANKLPLVKRSMRMLVDQLRPVDRVAIVVYAGAAGLILDSTPGTEKTHILDAIENLEAGGSTAGAAGLRLAYRVARRNFLEEGNNRVILATDGDFNVGESSDSEMVRLIEEKRREGVFLTVLGVGTGNLQAEKMESLAQHGNGNFAYIDSLLEARKVLVNEMGGTLLTVAQDVKLQVEFNPRHVLAYRLIGYENRLLANEDFNDDTKDAGDLGAGHSVTALYEIVPVGADTDVEVRSTDPLRYQDAGNDAVNPPDDASTTELAFVRIRYKPPTGTESRLLEHPVTREIDAPSEDFRFAAAVAGFGMLLRDSEHRGSITADGVLSLAGDGIGPDPEGYRKGFVELVRAYRTMEDGVAW